VPIQHSTARIQHSDSTPVSPALQADDARALGVSRLTLTNFRNYSFQRLDVGLGPVVLTGANGAGKTNILEALSLLTPGRGLRASPFIELAHSSATGPAHQWGVAAETISPSGPVNLGTSWTNPDHAAGHPSGRQVQVDGSLQKSSGMLGNYLRSIWLTPAMDRLFTGPASDRRRFLDRLTMSFDPGHGYQVQTFDKLMRERNRLLDQGHRSGSWLDGIEHPMAEAAAAIAAARRAAIDALSPLLAASGAASRGGHFPWVEIALNGDLEDSVAASSAIEAEENYRTHLAAMRERDGAAGRTLDGPHRSDLEVTHGPKGLAAHYCSTGEQKALLIGIVLAHARVIRAAFQGYCPVLLLDEVTAHLDEHRRAGLFDEITTLGAQAWVTGTDMTLFEAFGSRAQYLTVKDGKVHP
jgi:DNA replication and repair protein RecF